MNNLRLVEPVGYTPPPTPWYEVFFQNQTLVQMVSLFLGLVLVVSSISFLAFFIMTTNWAIKYLRSHDDQAKEKLIRRLRWMAISFIGLVVPLLIWMLLFMIQLLAPPMYNIRNLSV